MAIDDFKFSVYLYPFIACSCVVILVRKCDVQQVYIHNNVFTRVLFYIALQTRGASTILNVTVIITHLAMCPYAKVVTVNATTHVYTITSATAILLHLIKYLPVQMDNARVDIQVTIYSRTQLKRLFTDQLACFLHKFSSHTCI